MLHLSVIMQYDDAHAVHLLVVRQSCSTSPRLAYRPDVQIEGNLRIVVRQGFFPTARHHKRQCECRQADYNAMYNVRFHQLNPSI